jgi:hypothetical protein
MKNIKNYKKFLEDLTINLTDDPTTKMEKQDINTNNEHLKEYNTHKNQLIKIYTAKNTTDGSLLYDDTALQMEVEKLLGKSNTKTDEDRNPFLQELTTVLNLQRKIEKLQKDNLDDKLTKDDLNQNKNGETDTNALGEISNKIKEIDTRTNLNNTSITKLTLDYNKSKKDFDDKMSVIIKDLKDSETKLKNIPQK